MRAAVLRVRRVVVTRIERKLLAVADGLEAIAGKTDREQVRARGNGTTFSQRQIVLGAAGLVAVAFDSHGPGRIALEQVRVLAEDGNRVRAQLRTVEREEYRFERRVP